MFARPSMANSSNKSAGSDHFAVKSIASVTCSGVALDAGIRGLRDFDSEANDRSAGAPRHDRVVETLASVAKRLRTDTRSVFALGLSLLLAGTQVAQAQCYVQADTQRVTPANFAVVMPTTCPSSNNQKAYMYFPQMSCVPNNLVAAMKSTWNLGEVDHRIWAMRWNGGHNKNPNPINPPVTTSSGKQCRLEYTSIARADAATEAGTSATLGYGAHDIHGQGYLDWTEAAGIPDSQVYDYVTFAANADSLCTKSSGALLLATDVVVLPPAALSNVPLTPREGVEIDYEVQDNHSIDQTNALLTNLSQMVHQKGYRFLFYTNPLDGKTLRCCSGIGPANVDYIQSLVDRFGILVWQNNPTHTPMLQSLANQLALFQHPDYSKMSLTVDMAMTPDNARGLRKAITETYPFAGIQLWLDGVTLKGDCSTQPNQVLGIMSGLVD